MNIKPLSPKIEYFVVSVLCMIPAILFIDDDVAAILLVGIHIYHGGNGFHLKNRVTKLEHEIKEKMKKNEDSNL